MQVLTRMGKESAPLCRLWGARFRNREGTAMDAGAARR